MAQADGSRAYRPRQGQARDCSVQAQALGFWGHRGHGQLRPLSREEHWGVEGSHTPLTVLPAPGLQLDLSGPKPQVFKNPKYNAATINNDITLLKLASSARFSTTVSAVCLPSASDNFPAGTLCATTGWGLTKHTSEKPARRGEGDRGGTVGGAGHGC